jgi:general nucleoside transport system ATP-binding protein
VKVDEREVVLRMEGITKTFGDVVANDDITLEIRKGEVHALLGENGAGKTTLMSVLYGLYRPDSGRIFVKGKEAHISSPKAAIRLNIGMVHQHFMLVPPFTVAENVVLGLPSSHWPFPDIAAATKRISELAETYGLQIEPNAPVASLPLGMQQRVEIIKAIYRGADILILDEPTAVLTPQETAQLLGILRRLVDEGHAVVFISHKLEEVMKVSDRVTVLRDGRVVKTMAAQEATPALLANMMVGREVLTEISRADRKPGEMVLCVRDLQVKDDRGLLALKGVSFCVRRGEILGIAGVDGNGQRELAQSVTGLRKPHQGSIEVLGHNTAGLGPRDLIKMNVGHIPEDRRASGLVLDFSISENLILETYERPPFAHGPWLSLQTIKRSGEKLLDDFDIRAPSAELQAKSLSGGNQQKVILARVLSRQPDLLISAHATRGLDVGAAEYVHRCLLEQRDRGAGIVYISTELEEVLALSDRIAVMFGGQFMGIVPAGRASIEEIGLMMAGAKKTGYFCREESCENTQCGSHVRTEMEVS